MLGCYELVTDQPRGDRITTFFDCERAIVAFKRAARKSSVEVATLYEYTEEDGSVTLAYFDRRKPTVIPRDGSAS